MFRKVSDDMATKYRGMLNAATMLGQAKTVIQVSPGISYKNSVACLGISNAVYNVFVPF